MRAVRMLAIMLSVLAALGIGTVALAAPGSAGRFLAALEVTPGSTPTDIAPGADITATATITATPSVTSTLALTTTLPVSGTIGKQVPVAISKYFSVTVTQIEELHKQGMGFGEIVKAYDFAAATGKSLDEILAMREAGAGWGKIAQDLIIKPGKWGVNLGQIVSGKATPIATSTPIAGSAPSTSATPSSGNLLGPSMKGKSAAPDTERGNNGQGNGKGKK